MSCCVCRLVGENVFVIGLGLSDVEDVIAKGLKAIQVSDSVYLEHYTSILGGDASYKDELERFYGKSIELPDEIYINFIIYIYLFKYNF